MSLHVQLVVDNLQAPSVRQWWVASRKRVFRPQQRSLPGQRFGMYHLADPHNVLGNLSRHDL